MTALLGIDVISPLVSPWADQLALAKRGKFNVGKIQVAPQFATAPENVGQLLDVLVPGPNGRKTIIYRTDDAKFGAADIRTQFVDGGFDDFVGQHPDVDHYIEVGNEPDHAGVNAAQQAVMLRDAITLKGQIGHGRLSWLASMATNAAALDTVLPATAGYEGLAAHWYSWTDPATDSGGGDWKTILDRLIALDRAVWITEIGIDDKATAPLVKAQRILSWLNRQPARVVGGCIFTLGTGTHWPQYELTPDAADFYGTRGQSAPAPAQPPAPAVTPPAKPPTTPPLSGGIATVNDYAGFDATVPLQVPNYARYPWTAIYVHGENATRILPIAEQEQLPTGQALLPLSVPLNRCPGCLESGMTPAKGKADGQGYSAVLSQRGWQPGQLVSIDWEAGTENVPGFGTYGRAMVETLKDKGFLVGPYATPGVLGALLDAGAPIDAVFLTHWTRTTADDDVTRWWRARYPMFAWQWGGFVTNADLDLCTPQFYGRLRGAVSVDEEAQYADFDTKFRSSGGMYQAWLHNGGLTAFGNPISQEYDTTDENGKPVRRQWYERAVAEWRAGQWPANWDVTFMLLGDFIRDNGTTLQHLIADKAAHPAAFVAPA